MERSACTLQVCTVSVTVEKAIKDTLVQKGVCIVSNAPGQQDIAFCVYSFTMYLL